MRTFFASLMVICSMVLMQIHSIDFWREKSGPSGWGWSIGLEVAMLWFWYENKRRLQVFKYLAAFLLIAGPWYQITAPTFKSLNSVAAIQVEIAMTEDAVKQYSTSIDRYEKRSDKRYGWTKRIDKTTAKWEKTMEHLSTLRAKGAKSEAPWRSKAVAGMQAAALLIVLTAQLAAVTSLRCRNVTTVTESVTPKRNGNRNVVTEQIPEDYEATVITVASEIVRRVKEFGSQAKFCRGLNLRPADVSMVLNHTEKKEAGAGTIGPKALQKMVGVLGVAV